MPLRPYNPNHWSLNLHRSIKQFKCSVLALLDNPLVNYLIRLQKIYTLDLEVLDRLIALLKGVNVEVGYTGIIDQARLGQVRSGQVRLGYFKSY